MFDIYWYDYDDCSNISELITKAKMSSRTEYIWLAHRSVDYSNFNWRWVPNYHQKNFYHAWPSHNNLNCLTTWLIPIEYDFENTEKVYHWELGLLGVIEPASGKLWNWIKDDRIDYSNFNFNWFPDVHDWGYNHEFTMGGKNTLSYTTLTRDSKKIKYHNTNLSFNSDYTIPKYYYDYDDCVDILVLIAKAKEKYSDSEFIWLVHSGVDYTNFDFDWHPDGDQVKFYHAWASHNNPKCYTTWLIPQNIDFNRSNLEFQHVATNLSMRVLCSHTAYLSLNATFCVLQALHPHAQ